MGTCLEPADTSKPQTAVPPIHRLPPELVVELARWVGLQDLIRLTQVCRGWCTFIEGTPSLWSSIDAAEGEAAISIAFTLARNSPIDLQFREDERDIALKTFFELAGKRVEQWRSLVVDLTPCSLFGYNIFADDNDGPHVHLQITARQYILKAVDSGLLHLEAIKLADIPINIASLHLTNLKSLTLRTIHAVTPATIFDILAASPLIEVVDLRDMKSLTISTLSRSGLPDLDIPLVHLRQLSLRELHIFFIEFFLSVIQAPPLRKFVLDCPLDDRLPSQRHCEPFCRQIVPSAPMTAVMEILYVTLYSSYAQYQFKSDSLDITITNIGVSINDLQECFDWISNTVGQPLHHVPLTLELRECPAEPQLLEWFTRRANVTRLIIRDANQGNLLRIIPFLGRPTTSTPATWLVPGVEALETNLVWAHMDESVLDSYLKEDQLPPDIVKDLYSTERATRVEAVRKIRQLGYQRGTSIGQLLIDADLVTTIVNIMLDEDTQLRDYAVTIVAAFTGESSARNCTLAEAGVIPKLIDIANGKRSPKSLNHSLLALGNMAHDSKELRQSTFQQGGMNPPLDVLRNAANYPDAVYWASNALLDTSTKMAESSMDLILFLLVLRQIMDGNDVIEATVQRGVIPRLVCACDLNLDIPRHESLSCIKIMARSSEEGSKQLIKAGALEAFARCMKVLKIDGPCLGRKEICWSAFHLATRNFKQTQAVISAGLLPALTQENKSARQGAAYTLWQVACKWGTEGLEGRLSRLLEAGAIEALCMALSMEDSEIVDSLEAVLAMVKTEYGGRLRAVERVIAGKGIQQIRAVRVRRDLRSTDVPTTAQDLLEVYFPDYSTPPRV
ncbi:Importin subunit alpha-4 [Tulasnella sp. 427]|nr:Importin subunit alpha-4 [Tulasnella sp. 427]